MWFSFEDGGSLLPGNKLVDLGENSGVLIISSNVCLEPVWSLGGWVKKADNNSPVLMGALWLTDSEAKGIETLTLNLFPKAGL